MTAMLLLSACATTTSSVDVICKIPKPSISEESAADISDEDLKSLDLYFERLKEGCKRG